jgi:dihydrofolate reductase
MKQPIVSIIVAIQQKDRGIGRGNDLLFKISEDQKRFKLLTTGHVIIMGRKTFESIGRPLPNRTSIVITRNEEWRHEGVLAVQSLAEAVQKARELEQEEIFIIGGSEVYAQALPFADRLYLTVVEGNEEADTFFPPYEMFTKEAERGEDLIDPMTGVTYHHSILEKNPIE